MAFEDCLFLDALVDVEELACSFKCVRSVELCGLSFARNLADMFQLISTDYRRVVFV